MNIFILISKLEQAERYNNAAEYKEIEREATQLLMNLKNEKIYTDFWLKRINNYNLRCLKGSNDEANDQIKIEKMSKCFNL